MRYVRKNDEAPMPKDEGNPNDETPKDAKVAVRVFAIRAFIRRSDFVIG
jgi:hypothetical protein